MKTHVEAEVGLVMGPRCVRDSTVPKRFGGIGRWLWAPAIVFLVAGSRARASIGDPNTYDVCSPCECCDDCETGLCAGGTAAPEFAPDPIYLYRGSVVERATDLSLPGRTFGWSHRRTYDSRLSSLNGYAVRSPNGERWWAGTAQTYFAQSGSALVLHTNASTKRTFSSNGQGWYLVPEDLDAEFGKTGTGAAEEYRLVHRRTGNVFVFYGFNASINSWERGKLKERTSEHLELAEEDGIQYSYDNQGRLDVVATSQGWEVDYIYNSQYLTDKIERILVKNGEEDDPQDPDANVIRKAEYWYVGDGKLDYDGDVGTTGCLPSRNLVLLER